MADAPTGPPAVPSDQDATLPLAPRPPSRDTTAPTCDQRVAPPPPCIPGFAIRRLIGQGGMGKVYEAWEEVLGRRVAIKIIRAEHQADPIHAERFLREGRAMAALAHPRIVAVHSVSVRDDLMYMVLAYMPGGTVRDLLRAGGPLGIERSLALAADAAAGLAGLHAAGLVHRDIKPANLLLDGDGRAVLGDLGMARQISGDDRVTITGMQLGTPAYMAPEQMQGLPDIDGRADIYGLGATLYFMLTGRAPFNGASVFDTVHRAMSQPIPDLRAHCPQAPPGVVRLYQRMMARDRAHRHQSAEELAADLARVRAGEEPLASNAPVAAAPVAVPIAAPPAPVVKTSPWLLVATVAVLAGGAGALLWAARGVTPPEPAPQAPAGDPERDRLRLFLAEPAADIEHIAAARVDSTALRRRGGQDALVQEVEQRLARLGEIAALVESLAILDRVHALPADLAPALARDLARLTDLAPRRGDLARWRAVLLAREQRIALLRRDLAALDGQPPPPAPRWPLLAGAQAELEALAGPDAASTHWGESLRALRERALGLRLRLGLIDQLPVLPELLAGELAEALADYRALGCADAGECERWQRRLEGARSAVAELRQRLRLLDGAAAPAEAAGLTHDLMRLQQLVGGGDAELQRWSARLSALAADPASLRARLRMLDLEVEMPEPTVEALARELERLAAAGDDPEAARWRQRLAESRATLAARRQELARCDREGALAAAELAALRTASARLRPLVDPADPALAAATGRLDRETLALAGLRTRLAVLDEPAPHLAPAALRADLADLARRAEAGDADLLRWRVRLDETMAERERLRALLAPLDAPGAAPAGAEAALARLRALGEGGPELERWQAALGALAAARRRLAAGGSAAEAALADLERLAGPQDAEVLRWRARLRGPQALAWDPGTPAWAASSGRDAAGRWALLTVGAQDIRLRACPPGRLRMGGDGADEVGHDVQLTRGWWLAETEVTQALWQEVTGTRPSYQFGAALPAENVSWHDCQGFLRALRARCPGFPARLPSEAEWEMACRLAVAGQGVEVIAWHRGNAGDRTHPVGSRRADAGGFHDLLGNVGEWCADAFVPFPAEEAVDPLPGEGSQRVVRGGSWMSQPGQCRAELRQGCLPSYGKPFVGLRLAADP
jgi:tRNA A-37 threonylcarbamoyl transferase component Bud32